MDFMSPSSLTADPRVKDELTVKRSWFERLFTKPWQPWISTKTVKIVRFIQHEDGTYHVSPETMKRITEYRIKKLYYNA